MEDKTGELPGGWWEEDGGRLPLLVLTQRLHCPYEGLVDDAQELRRRCAPRRTSLDGLADNERTNRTDPTV